MNRSQFRENGEQGFPYILPVLRSYKQSAMFVPRQEHEFELELPEINSRSMDSYGSPQLKQKKKGKKRKNFSKTRKNTMNLKYSPHFNVASIRHSFMN